MRDSVPSTRYSSVCNVLRQWNIPLIPTYRVYRLYDSKACIYIYTTACLYMLSLPCLSGLIRRFALHNMCDLNTTSWAASVAQLVERLP